MSEEEERQRELAFYKNQTQVLREKNRDLRNALLLAESKEGEIDEEQETAEESLSDIKKIIADSKKSLTEKLSQFKDTVQESKETDNVGTTPKTATPSAAPMSMEAEVLQRQCEYLKVEVERLENFLEQSEMVNNRLQELLASHSIDVSEITKAINEASKTAVSQKAVQQPAVVETKAPVETKEEPIPEPVIKETAKAPVAPTPTPKPEVKKELDPEVKKLFDSFKAKLTQSIGDEDIKMEILNFREHLMDLIPHSRVFYEMQMEYRKWKRGTSSISALKDAIVQWEKTIKETQV